MTAARPGPPRGRRPSTTHAEVERAALELFARDGFEQTTMDDIADALGIGRRTLFRYFPSKNDIVWGDFELVLDRLGRLLYATPRDVPIMRALADAIIESNRYPPDQLAGLRIRMTLITTVPALQAHSMLRYRAWRQVVAEFVADRRGESPDDLVPQTIGYALLGTSTAAFAHWVDNPDEDLDASLAQAYGILRASVAAEPESLTPLPRTK
jgi:TetR/AcrR family transcriptional regulator, regulator of mycofactocin system